MTPEDFLNPRLGVASFIVAFWLVTWFLRYLAECGWREWAKLNAQLHKERTGKDKPWQDFMPHD